MKILCIDGARALSQDYLVGLVDVGGYTTRFCWTREQVIKNALDMRPDLILLSEPVLDIVPDKVLEDLERERITPRIPVLLVCTEREIFERLCARHPVVGGWIRRPFDPMELAELVRSAWSRLKKSEYFS